MEQSTSWEANRSPASQKIPHILWYLKVKYHIHISPPPFPILSQINPSPSWRSILILTSHIHLGLPSGLFPSYLPTKMMYAIPLFPICATWPAHFILLNHPNNIWWGSTDDKTPCYVVFSTPLISLSLLGSNIFLSTLLSNTLNLCSSLKVINQVIPTQSDMWTYTHDNTIKKKAKSDFRFLPWCTWDLRSSEMCRLIGSYQRFGTTYQSKGQAVTTSLRCITSQKSKDLNRLQIQIFIVWPEQTELWYTGLHKCTCISCGLRWIFSANWDKVCCPSRMK